MQLLKLPTCCKWFNEMYTSLYYDKMIVRTSNDYDVFYSKLNEYDHYKIALKVYAFLKKNGFLIRPLKYHSVRNYNKAKNKIAIKDFIVVKTEISNRYFKIEVCHLNNIEKEMELNIWRKNDSRYIPFSYLEEKKLQLIRNKIERLLPEKIYEDEDRLSTVEKIIKSEIQNPHIHNGAKSLEDIKKYVESNNDGYYLNYNYSDKQKKLIVCGEKKYFYDYCNNRLSCGIVYHNINNMWWVLLSDGSRRNIVCFDLFDYSSDLPKRKPSLRKLQAFYNQQIQAENFERCIKLKKVIENLKTSHL